MAMVQNQWYHFGIGEFTTHFRTYFSGWIGLFTGLMIRVLTHGHMGVAQNPTGGYAVFGRFHLPEHGVPVF